MAVEKMIRLSEAAIMSNLSRLSGEGRGPRRIRALKRAGSMLQRKLN